jgi:HEAT repeat protein
MISTLAVALLALGASAVTAQGKKDDPAKKKETITEVGGKSSEQWLAAITSRDRSISSAAVKTILLFGPEQGSRAVPVIIGELKKHRPGSGQILDASFRANAPITLTLILTRVKKPDEQHVVETIDLLTGMLRDPQVIIRYRAAQALRHFGPAAQKAITDLLTVAKEVHTWENRQAAVAALGAIAFEKDKGPALRVLNLLYSALKDSSSLVRVEAIRALETLGVPEVASYRPGLEQNLEPLAAKDPDPMVRIWANLILYNVDEKKTKLEENKNKGRRTTIAEFLKHPEHPVRSAAADALGLIGPDSKDQLPALAPLLDEKDNHGVVLATVVTVGRIGPDARAFLPRLRAIAASKELPGPLKEAAEAAIDEIEGKTKKDSPKKGAGK